MAMMAIWVAVLISYGISTGIAMHSAAHRSDDVLTLDMAPDSVDDMYSGCKDKMRTKANNYLKNEKNADSDFTLAWKKAEKKWPKKKPGREQKMAIYVYTLNEPNIYLNFNNAVRTQRSMYKTTFRYHALHFFLTDALQTLNSRKSEEERCLTGYRRVNSYFSQDVLNKEIRFGTFTSSRRDQYPHTDRFGDKSCFEIATCFGADISLYSELGESEREVLIPPYEVFKVIRDKEES
ncbi:ecto-ADP-ribosyltransferase 5 [Lates calcarifer]|uniref:NAD(P)(+)--arginine ADP-ribosyltransferase n=1 Tax=Lates calcarifer TaxID=8187 RepID=A0A4W6FRN8_LATCA|nr:ecto-ADP-ribosyltransferase 5 [Lates calcarifer]